MKRCFAVSLLVASLLTPGSARSEKRAIDVNQSRVTVRVYKAGLFSAFGDDHEIAAPIAEGTVDDSSNPSVQLRFEAAKIRVLDPQLSPDKRAEVQRTMEGPKVLDTARYPEISFRSTSIEKAGAGRWIVNGNLTLHGQTHPVLVEVSLQAGHYRGSARLKQRDFGITPVSVAGGTVKVKDEIKIEFDVALAE